VTDLPLIVTMDYIVECERQNKKLMLHF